MKLSAWLTRAAIIVTGLISSAQASDFKNAQILENVGFSLPETVLHNEKQDVYLVSNIEGKIPEKDDNGFISKVSPDGTVIDLKWIDGANPDVELHSPKGMALRGNQLFVADIDTVRIFNSETGVPEGEIKLEGTTFLNDIILGENGKLYTTDSGLDFIEGGFKATQNDAIYQIDEDGKVEKWVQNTDLAQPNGLELLPNGKIGVVTRGGNQFYRLTDEGTKEQETALPGKILDGLVMDNKNRFFITSWETSKLYLINEKGAISTFADLPVPAANIGYDKKRNQLLLPLLKENRIAFLKTEKSS